MAESDDAPPDTEVSAIQTVLAALEPLNADARERVIGFVFHRLGVSWPTGSYGTPRPWSDQASSQPPAGRPSDSRPSDIRSLREQKNPRTAIEMTTLVGYYLENLAPPGERKAEFSEPDLVRYFKQAAFPLPKTSHMTLVNAKNAGYIDAAGRGLYRLNAVGHNLITHGLPRGGGETEKPAKGRRTSRKPKTRK